MHFDQNIIIVIVAAVIGISRLVARIAENARRQSEKRDAESKQARRAPPPLVATPPKSDEQRVREFLEALGQPAGATPPAKVQPRTDVPPRPVAPVTPPMPRPFSPVFPRPIKESARRFFQPKSAPPVATAPESSDEPGTWLREEKQMKPAPPSPEPQLETAARVAADSGWKNALRSRDSVQTAVVLREILGPPRGLAPAE